MSENTGIVDLTYLNEMTDGEESAIKEMIDIFFEQVEEYNEAFKNLLAKEAWNELGSLAHKAKSTVSVMGMNELADDLKKLELDAKKAVNTENYSKIVAKFEANCAQAKTELEEIYNNL